MKNNDVRKMSQEDFDKVPEGQKSFYQGLFDTGQLLIEDPVPVTGTLPGTSKKEKDKQSRQGPFDKLYNQAVIVTLSDSSQVSGKLTTVYMYEIVLDDGLIVIMKHAIITIKQGSQV